MEHKDVFLIEQIIDFCQRLTSAIDELAVSEDNFMNNLRLQDLSAFYILQIGEVATELSERFKAAHPEIQWHRIIGFRNIIAHAYGTVDPEILWEAATKNVPELLKFCKQQIG